MIFLFLLPVISILPGVAQSSSDLKISPQNNEIISPTPSSAQQMRYQSPQPALATGAVNLSIPLYTIDIEGLKIPFTLNYHTSGIKPSTIPSLRLRVESATCIENSAYCARASR